YRGSWLSLGTASPDAEGRARIVAEGPAVAAPAEALEVTLEPSGGSAAPTGPPLIAWPKP
ncbi:MAG TPA: hypothetical protein VFY49_11540, partial [Myxococcota bacterium]|nr:hypothetical protein [Myxococcota bacterium]